jgi:two-component system phosphate regulon sensor histidine kinase PhoR
MKKINIKIIVILTSAALIGLSISQLYWINNAIHLSEKQYDHRVTLALDDIMEDFNHFRKTIDNKEKAFQHEVKSSLVHFFNTRKDTIPFHFTPQNQQSGCVTHCGSSEGCCPSTRNTPLTNTIFNILNEKKLDTVFEYNIIECINAPEEEQYGVIYFELPKGTIISSDANFCINKCYELELVFPKHHSTISIDDESNMEALDSIMKQHFIYHDLDTVYEYAIKHCGNEETKFKKDGIISDEFSHSCHIAGMNCVLDKECYNLEVYFPEKTKFVVLKTVLWLILSILFILIVLFAFIYVIRVILKQKKLSEVKNDFINNMTHEFKTPITTISMSSEVLLKADPQKASDRISKYSKIIFDENQRLKKLVEQILQTAKMDRNQLQLNKEENTDIHAIIQDSINSFCFDDCDKNVSIKTKLEAEHHTAAIDPLHFRNLVVNLLDNAYKYSDNNPSIEVSTNNSDHGIIIGVKDNGIGMSKDVQKKIFKKFYRPNTGNIHNIKGFGLGLYYVSKIVALHNGSIKVDSAPDTGSYFEVFIPFK